MPAVWQRSIREALAVIDLRRTRDLRRARPAPLLDVT
jgi:hypothetical protein